MSCPGCGATLEAVDVRGVRVERCNACDYFFLEPGEVGLISQRVLISARSPKGRQPLSQNPILVEMLRNPRSSR